MTSEVSGDTKTNEFLHRRKLRLQQVREQSKDIAKQIRQRAKLEKFRQIVELDSKKQQEFLEKQNKLVKKLERCYASGVESVGAGHKNAVEEKPHNENSDVINISKQRGKDAVAEIRRKKQEKLDNQKKILDRKLQAREAANEISREKVGASASRLTLISNVIIDKIKPDANKNDVSHNDMGTQWEVDELPEERTPNIPTLSLPKDDTDSNNKESNNNIESKSDKSKRLDLFALSEEMPSSLRGGTGSDDKAPVRPSLTLISEYLQNRGLRLRETEKHSPNRNAELQKLRQTILCSRNPREGIGELCHVHDEEKYPVPVWQTITYCNYCYEKYYTPLYDKYKNPCKVHNIVKAKPKEFINPMPILKGYSPFKRDRISLRSCPIGNCGDRISSTHSSGQSRGIIKNSVTVYNHSTRDTRDIPCQDRGLVIRDEQNYEDAYSQAAKASNDKKKSEDAKKMQDVRSKVVMTKMSVEKEYKDTMNFLNSMPKNMGSKPMQEAYMDEHRQELRRETRQRKMQDEYHKIQKECKRQTCRNKTRTKSKSPTLDEEMYKDFQYSWMPVPESDSNLAIHTIPTALKESKSNNVKFSKVDSYHEYRSRHKHTPPTKEPIMIDIPKNMESERLVYSNSESDASEYSSDEHIRLQKRRSSKDSDLSEAEKVVIYKILQSKNKRTNQKLLKEIAKSLSLVDNSSEPLSSDKGAVRKNRPPSNSVPKNKVSFDLKEGIYKAVSNNRISFNSMSCCQTNIELWRSTCERKPWWHDVSSMYYERRESDGTECIPNDTNPILCCKRKLSCGNHDKGAESPQWQSGDTPPSPKTGISNRSVHSKPTMETIMETATGSNCSYKTASTHSNAINKIPEDGFIKMIDESGHESGKFYIGASGFLKDKDYEVVIQLRKKGDEKRDKELRADDMTKESVKHNTPVSNSEEKITEDQQTQPSSDDNETKKSSVDSNTHQVFHPTIDFIINQNDDVAVSTPRKEPMNKQNSVPEPQPSFKSVAEKAVGTSFIDDYNIADHIPYSEPMEKPTTSAYAQTSESTPCNNRPMYFHMSSSTSTAYMSPPELILPNFLKKGMIKPRYSRDNGRDQFLSEKTSKPCICQKCIKSKRSCEFDDDYRERHSVNLKTPPNSARSPSSSNSKDYNYNTESNKELANKKPCLKCRKCSSRKQLSTHFVKPSRCNIYAKYARNASKLGTSSTKPKNGFTNKKIKSTLNPLIKNYIIKLLDLNKGGLKAIQVMNQDCSAVTTPASSIINVQQNINNNRTNIENHISLERIKSMVVKQIMDEIKGFNRKSLSEIGQSSLKNISIRSTKNKITRNKPKHKVKSLNIPKKITNTTKSLAKTQSSTSSFNNIHVKTKPNECKSKYNKGNSTPDIPKLKLSPIIKANKNEHPVHNKKDKNVSNEPNPNNGYNSSVSISASMPINSHRATTTTTSNSLELEVPIKFQKNDIITNISTQTSNMDGELQFVKLAEDKIQNMEKIADLTEKCTQRLSNLAKVLDKVRKNKSLAYSQIVSENNSDSSDQKSDKADNSPRNYDINVEVQKLSETPLSEPREYNNQNKVDGDNNISPYLSNFERFLNDIPKPVTDHPLSSTQVSSTSSSKQSTSASDDSDNFRRPKPPPALSRVHLRHLQTAVVPHELSTVIEVESPMSIKQKTLTSRSSKQESEDLVDRLTDENDLQTEDPKVVNTSSGVAPTTKNSEANTNEPSEETKHVMIDLKQFNEIMLKPFLSITEYAKHYDIGVLEEGSNLEDIVKDDLPNEDISSLHSDGSLPDVISELLKRNLIAEPFKFDTASNINSTTVSSDSTLSMLALSKVKKKSSVMFQNKENIAETSDSLSMSSNPDLENAFKKLGMGWASSTLKKTKERLALSSSSNTSSSSMAQFKLRSFNQDVPALVTDNVSSVLNTSKQRQKRNNATDSAKNAEQQTTMTNSMTVKEFLNNELAKRITFTNKSRNETEEEFVSLFETKMPEEMKHSSRMIREEGSIDNSMRSGNNRARTSTPVQLYKSMTYHSSSSSNVSNGLFSNLDEISSVKQTSNSMKHSTSDKDDLTIPNFSLKKKKCPSDCSKSD